MKPKVKREIVEWVILVSIVGIIYIGGWHTEVIGRVQSLVLSLGFVSPDYVEEGNKASYDFWLEDINGNKVSFSENQGEVTFVNFWATWCPPCIAEMPDIHNLYEKRGDSISFVMISLDQDEKKAKNYISKKDYQFPVYFLRSRLPTTYDTHSIPTTYLLDRVGNIRVEKHGMAKYDSDKFNQLISSLLETK